MHETLMELAAETRDDPSSELLWTLPTERAVLPARRDEPSIAPDAVGDLFAGESNVPFYLECEHRARHPRGVWARLWPYVRYYRHGKPEDDHPPLPFTLFVVDGEDVEETYVRTSARMDVMTVPVPVSCRPVQGRRQELSARTVSRLPRQVWPVRPYPNKLLDYH